MRGSVNVCISTARSESICSITSTISYSSSTTVMCVVRVGLDAKKNCAAESLVLAVLKRFAQDAGSLNEFVDDQFS